VTTTPPSDCALDRDVVQAGLRFDLRADAAVRAQDQRVDGDVRGAHHERRRIGARRGDHRAAGTADGAARAAECEAGADLQRLGEDAGGGR